MKNRIIRFAIALVVLGILIAIAVWRYTFRASETSVSGKIADIEISASELLNKFENNEDSANIAFLDKIILVTGTVDNIKEDSTGVSVYLKNSESISGVMCSFDRTAINPAKIKSGETLKIKGICTGYLMDVVMNKCSLEE